MKNNIINRLDHFERSWIKGNKLLIVPIIVCLLFGLVAKKSEFDRSDYIPVTYSHYEEEVTIDDVEERAFQLIATYEGFKDKPYWDHKQWSCGYGMKCSKNTTGITKEKSKQFVMDRIKSIRDRHNLYPIDDNIEVGLISFTYNVGKPPHAYRRYIDNGYINALKNTMLRYTYAGGEHLHGLYKRRVAETNF